MYNGIYNLQMLDANENMSKNDINLEKWIENETKTKDKKQFLDNHLIPDVDFSFSNFHNFIDEREKILILMTIHHHIFMQNMENMKQYFPSKMER